MKTITSAKIKKVKHSYTSLGLFKDADTNQYKAFDESGNSEVLTTGIIGPQGPQGIQGTPGPVGPAGLNWKGEWTTSTSYVKDDAVGYDGSSYFCILATNGTTTPDLDNTHWAFLASRGSDGPQGPVGPAGLGMRIPNNGLYPTSKIKLVTKSLSVSPSQISYEGVNWAYQVLDEYTNLTVNDLVINIALTVTGTLNFPTHSIGGTSYPTLCAINLYYPTGTLNENSGVIIKSTKEYASTYTQYYSYRIVATDHIKVFIWQTAGTLESANYNLQLFNVNL